MYMEHPVKENTDKISSFCAFICAVRWLNTIICSPLVVGYDKVRLWQVRSAVWPLAVFKVDRNNRYQQHITMNYTLYILISILLCMKMRLSYHIFLGHLYILVYFLIFYLLFLVFIWLLLNSQYKSVWGKALITPKYFYCTYKWILIE